MKLRGDYDGLVTYNVGDVVRYTNGDVCILEHPCKAGVPPIDTHYWGKASKETTETVSLILDAIEIAGDAAQAKIEEISADIPKNISEEAITLKGTGDAEYLITVDDSGETPDLSVTLIEDEEEEDPAEEGEGE